MTKTPIGTAAARAAGVLLPGLLLLAGCGGPGREAPAGGGRLPVAVSIPPLAWLVESLGGERVEVRVMLPPGASPHAWEPSPRQLFDLSRSRLYVAVGHPAFVLEKQHLESALAARPDLPVVSLTGGGAAPGGDPHLWLSPGVMREAAGEAAAALAEVDPEHAAGYAESLLRLEAEIDDLDREISAALEGLPRRRFWVHHPAWGRFASRYGLEQVALEEEGKEASPARLVRRIGEARREGVRVIFVQRGFSDEGARVLAAEIGASVVPLDPLAYDWPDNLRRVSEELAAALGKPGG